MFPAVRLLTPLTAVLFFAACGHVTPPGSHERERVEAPATALHLSPNKLVGRVLAVDLTRGFAIVNLTAEPPPAALADGAVLIARTDDLRETARIQASRYVRGRTLGTKIVSGKPQPGDEVVIFAP